MTPTNSGAVKIAEDIYQVSTPLGLHLESNVYLRIYRKGAQQVNMLIDPGAKRHLPTLKDNLNTLIGGMDKVNVAFINHQDPDVAFNTDYFQKLNPKLFVLCSEDTWRLINFYDLDPKQYKGVESFPNLQAKINTGQLVDFVPSRYCHFRGAMMLYDRETRVLFSGDFLGGLTYVEGLYADERHWEGIRTFHQIYMPSRQAMKLAVENIRKLDPKPELIAPQHGSMLRGKWIDYYLNRIEKLPVGLDLIAYEHLRENYVAMMNEAFLELSRLLGPEEFASTIKYLRNDGSFITLITFDQNGFADFQGDPNSMIESFISSISLRHPDKLEKIRQILIQVLLSHNLPLPGRLLPDNLQPSTLFL
jgi:glyoxylase-like metal-dependent hydrolase (beta-lactamase superfamily II)